MLWSMSTKQEPAKMVRFYIRTTDRLRSNFQEHIKKIEGSPSFSKRSRMLSQEQFMNAVWLMLKEEDADTLAERLGPYVAKAREALDSAIVPKKGKGGTSQQFATTGEEGSGDKGKKGKAS